jgi:hypothetical protein
VAVVSVAAGLLSSLTRGSDLMISGLDRSALELAGTDTEPVAPPPAVDAQHAAWSDALDLEPSMRQG